VCASVFCSVRLRWVSGHFDVSGNETGYQLAKIATGPEPALGVSTTSVCTNVYQWEDSETLKIWQSTKIYIRLNYFLMDWLNDSLGLVWDLIRDLMILTGHLNWPYCT